MQPLVVTLTINDECITRPYLSHDMITPFHASPKGSTLLRSEPVFLCYEIYIYIRVVVLRAASTSHA